MTLNEIRYQAEEMLAENTINEKKVWQLEEGYNSYNNKRVLPGFRKIIEDRLYQLHLRRVAGK